MKEDKGFAPIIILIIILVVSLAVGISFGVIKSNKIISVGTPVPSQTPRSLVNVPTPTSIVNPASSSQSCKSSWAVSGSENVQFLVTDPNGVQTGFDRIKDLIVQNIPDSSYGLQPGIGDDTGKSTPMPSRRYFGMNDPINSVYILQIFAEQAANYDIDVATAFGPSYLKNENLPFSGTLTTNQIDKYKVSFSDGSILKVNN